MITAFTDINRQFFTLHNLYPSSSVYNIPLLYKIQEHCKLRSVISTIISTFPLLLSKTTSDREGNIAFIKKEETDFYYEHQVSSNEIDTFIKNLINQRMNIDEGLIQIHHIQITEECSYLLILQHHIITDLRSKEILIHFIEDAFNKNSFPKFELMSIEEEDQSKISFFESFWEKHICHETLHLPSSEFGRKPFSGKGDSIGWKCPRFINEKMQSIDREKVFSPFIFFLTVYSVFLHRVSGQSDFNIGVPFTNRQREHEKNQLGAFVNILPLKILINSSDTFQDVYLYIRRQMLLLHRVQSYPFIKVSQFYKGERNIFYPHVLQAGFTQEPIIPLRIDGVEVTPVSMHPEGAQMDLFFTYWTEDRDFAGRWEYNSDAFSREQVSTWINIFNDLLGSAVSDISNHISVPIKTQFFPTAISTIYQPNGKNYPVERHIASLLLDSYARNSESIAIVTEDNTISYIELNKRVTSIAACLTANYGTGKHIAVIMEKSAELIIALHAIVVAGNVFVPVDPSWPCERQQFVIDDAEVACILTNTNCESISTPVPILTLDSFIMDSSAFSVIPLEQDAPIYLLYTSGSTGNPKGALLPSNGIINRLYWMQDTFPISQADTLIQKTPFTFDVSMWEIFWPFLFGARLFVPDAKRWIDNEYILKCIDVFKISYIHFVPSMLRLFLSINGPAHCPNLRGVICSGEAIDKELYREYLQCFPHIPLFNLYGPTEASIDVSWHACSPVDLSFSSVPIGRPVANTALLILDDKDNLCPPYVEGNLCIGGIQLAQKYWNRDDLTSKAFASILINGENIRIYRTGDRARYWHDGTIEYLGRLDSQIKINGVRIELSEIENEIDKNEKVLKSIVLYRGIENRLQDDKYLVAFLEGDYSEDDIKFIRGNLSRTLPGNMIPTIFLPLPEFPRLTNGKTDKRKLAAIPVIIPANNRALSEAGVSNSFTIVCSLWSELLNAESIDPDKNFFELGGHSILLLKMQKELEVRIGVKIELPLLFQYTTAKSLSDFIDGRQNEPLNKENKDMAKKQNIGRLRPRNRG